MDQSVAYSVYVPVDGAELFTLVCLPKKEGRFPTVIMRSPYVDESEEKDEKELEEGTRAWLQNWTSAGYAAVFQHCRGRGKSSGDCIPFIYEREDGLALQDWIRKQSFYNGELFLCGGSYTAAVHYLTAPFAPDIKGAVLAVFDTNWYGCSYRNGFFKAGLTGGWYFSMYKHKTIRNPSAVEESFNTLPLSALSEAVFGEKAEDFDEMLRHPDGDDPYWDKRFGVTGRNPVQDAGIPILFLTGFYDIFAGGTFDIWRGLDENTRKQSALLVHPYDHGGSKENQPVVFPDGMAEEHFGDGAVKWMEYVRGKGESPLETGKVTYYRLFENEWRTDDFSEPEKKMSFPLGEGERSYVYNPYAPAHFQGGLSSNFGGAAWQGAPDNRYDILSWFTPPFEKETFVKGKMRMKLLVKSDCEDTCFYVRLSLDKKEGAYGLRDDIRNIAAAVPDYKPGDEVELDFAFDEHAFQIAPGERIRIDVSSSAFSYFVGHTNRKGLFSEIDSAKIAHNTVIAGGSSLVIPVE